MNYPKHQINGTEIFLKILPTQAKSFLDISWLKKIKYFELNIFVAYKSLVKIH